MSVDASYRIESKYYSSFTGNSAGNLTDDFDTTIEGTFAEGTADNELNKVFSKTATLAISTPVTFDLSALASASGSVALTKLRKLLIRNLSATHALLVGGGTDPIPLFPSAITLPPGGIFFGVFPIGASVAIGGSSDQLKLDPSTNAVPYLIEISGL